MSDTKSIRFTARCDSCENDLTVQHILHNARTGEVVLMIRPCPTCWESAYALGAGKGMKR